MVLCEPPLSEWWSARSSELSILSGSTAGFLLVAVGLDLPSSWTRIGIKLWKTNLTKSLFTCRPFSSSVFFPGRSWGYSNISNKSGVALVFAGYGMIYSSLHHMPWFWRPRLWQRPRKAPGWKSWGRRWLCSRANPSWSKWSHRQLSAQEDVGLKRQD